MKRNKKINICDLSSNVNRGKNNTGIGNVGNKNSGNNNLGDSNSGDSNLGYCNSGYRNLGDNNSGDSNLGYGNSGYRNSGNKNSGNWNSGCGWCGCFNAGKSPYYMFGKIVEENIKIDFPDFFYFELIEWISSENMSEKEKKKHPKHKTLGGYLKTLRYKDAWRNSWNNATLEDKKKVLELPNFNNEIFKEITGIDVKEELKC